MNYINLDFFCHSKEITNSTQSHVMKYELTSLINDMVYGGRMQNIISSREIICLDFYLENEGLAEYLSSNWDTKADMTMRDIFLHEMPSVKELNYFMAYKVNLYGVLSRKIWKRKNSGRFSIYETYTK